ncbi:MAG TPA: hypothetical protein VFA41_04890 [Ktedonobacteraceae bacterium]|jgi:hypothetical protein|nr:hypothetical protein [Ktedonobacteraceae bacterium]
MIISMEIALEEMDLTVLTAYSMIELKRYRSKISSDDAYCVELTRRAIYEQKDETWAALQNCFGDTIRCWIRTHPQRDITLQYDTEENYLAQTFSRFWYAMRQQHIAFTSLASILSYLHATLNGILLDTMRVYQRGHTVPLPEPGLPGEPVGDAPLEVDSTWDILQTFLNNEREQHLFYLLYYCGLKPREILARCPGEFADAKEIYRLNQTIIERLRRNRDRLQWLLG